DPREARVRGWMTLAMGVGFMACAALVFLVARKPIVGLFSPDPQVIEVGGMLLLVAAGFQLFDGLQAVATGALRGLGDTRIPMAVNLVGHWMIGLPLAAVLGSGWAWVWSVSG